MSTFYIIYTMLGLRAYNGIGLLALFYLDGKQYNTYMRILAVLLFLAFSTLAGAVPGASRMGFEVTKDRLLLPKIIDAAKSNGARPVTYCIYIEEAVTNLTEAEAQKHIELAFKMWFDYSSAYIKQQKRQTEFSSIMKVIDKGFRIEKVNCNAEDIKIFLNNTLTAESSKTVDIPFLFVPQAKIDANMYDSNAYHFLYPQSHIFISASLNRELNNKVEGILNNSKIPLAPFISVLQRAKEKKADREKLSPLNNLLYFRKLDIYSVVPHELGHALGLGDQRGGGGEMKSSFIYGTRQTRPALMNEERFITCDDIDEFINRIDAITGTPREFYSLCNDGVKFKNGMHVNSKTIRREFSDFGDNENLFGYITYFTDSNETKSYLYEAEITFNDIDKTFEFLKNNKFERNYFALDELSNTRLRMRGIYKELPSGRIPVGDWGNYLFLGDGSAEYIFNRFDENGKKLLSILYKYDADDNLISQKELYFWEKEVLTPLPAKPAQIKLESRENDFKEKVKNLFPR